LKIALFAPYDLAMQGGIATHIRGQARALRALGHSVEVFGPASALPPSSDGSERVLGGAIALTFGGTTSGAALNPLVYRTVKRLFERETFDIVHVHEPLMPLLPWAAVRLARAPVVGTFHVYREHSHRWYRFARPLLHPIVNRLRARIAVSEAARRTVARFFPGDYEIVPNGVDVERFRLKQPRPSLLTHGSTVLCVGRLEPRKGVATLIEAMACVRRELPDVVLVLVGDGPDREALRAFAHGLHVRVEFANSVANDELPAYYQAADVVCAPALGGESFGIVLIEALAAGTPVVASRIDGYVAAAGETPCVRWAAPGDSAALASALITALQTRRTMSPDAALHIASAYDWTMVAARLLHIYRRAQAAPLPVSKPRQSHR
jgi:phosphatidylinositol alpha-mannosyltransferase